MSLRLFEMRPKPAGAAFPNDRIVLVVAASAEEAFNAVDRAIGAPAEGPFTPQRVEFHDLGQHTGPEEPGAVFVNGYLIAG